MAKDEKDPMRQRLRTVEDLQAAFEDLYNKQRAGEIDSKMSDGINTTLKGAMALNVKMPMDAWKLWVQASIKKVSIPASLKKALPISVE
jgi:hypothetical protein